MLIWKIAWRNLWRHKGKSLVIGVILFLGALLMTVGNAVIEGAKDGMAENMVNRFTGHVVLTSADQKDEAVFVADRVALKVIPDYPAIKAALQAQTMIDDFVPMTRGLAMILNSNGKQGQTVMLGVNFEEYQRVFLNNILPVEGNVLHKGERGILITEYTRERLFDRQKFWVVPKGLTVEQTVAFADAQTQTARDVQNLTLVSEVRQQAEQGRLQTVNDLIVLGFGTSSFGSDIRVPVQGIFKLQNLNQVLKDVSFMDLESYRECFGHISSANQTTDLSEQQQAVLNADSTEMDELFGTGEITVDSAIQTETYDLSLLQQHAEQPQAVVDPDQGVYNIVAVKLKPGLNLQEAQTRLQHVFDAAGMHVRVITWEQAIGPMSQLTAISQGALSVFVVFIFFVAIIVIMNTLSMAALERVTEIGMMRAIGARKSFISTMFLTETGMLAFLFGGAGIAAGVVVAWLLAALGIPVTSSNVLSLLFGGDTFHPVITSAELISGVIELGVVTILAVLYPLRIARKITPLEAISRD